MRSVSFSSANANANFSGNESGMMVVEKKRNRNRNRQNGSKLRNRPAVELSGEELDEYCRNRGLCKRCTTQVTHKRVVKLFGKDLKWEPLTVRKEVTGNEYATEYEVYRGYCIQESCFTMPEARRLLGENDTYQSWSQGGSGSSKPKNKFLNAHFSVAMEKLKRPSRRRMRTNPETGSVAESRSGSVSSSLSGRSQGTSATRSSFVSGFSGLSGISGFSTKSRSSRNRKSGSSVSKSGNNTPGSKNSNSRTSFGSRFVQKRRGSFGSWSKSRGTLDASDITMDEIDASARTAPVGGSSSPAATAGIVHGSDVSPIVAHRLEQLVRFDYFVVLYLNKTDLSTATGSSNIDAIVDALRTTKTLESITFERCSLDNDGIEKIAGALEEGGHCSSQHNHNLGHIHNRRTSNGSSSNSNSSNSSSKNYNSSNINRSDRPVDDSEYDDESEELKGEDNIHSNTNTAKANVRANAGKTGVLKTLRLKGNRIGNRGVQALEFLFRSSSTLEELDLSDNCIGSKGAASILESLAQNRVGIPLSCLNLSMNEIWDLGSDHSGNFSNNNEKNDSCHSRSSISSISSSLSVSGRVGGPMGLGTTLSSSLYYPRAFLHTNSTLRELNLDGNCLHDEGAEYIAESLTFNRNGVLEKLHLGFNGIGDNGAMALAKAIESNRTIKELGLAENDLTNTGARALLSALAVNVSMKEISGLYHNRIDRKFIIVAIKRLLHRKVEQGRQNELDHHHSGHSIKSRSDESLKSTASLIVEAVANAEETEDCDTCDTTSSSSRVEESTQPIQAEAPGPAPAPAAGKKETQLSESKLLSRGTNHRDRSTSSHGSLALEAIENWDWGTFGIDEIERRNSEDTELQIDQFLKDIEEELSQDGDAADFIDDDSDEENFAAEISESARTSRTEKSRSRSARASANANANANAIANTITANAIANANTNIAAKPPLLADRIVVFQAAPLAYFDRRSMQHHGVPLLDFAHEAKSLRDIFSGDETSKAGNVEVVFESATQINFHNFFTRSLSPVMHFSCYGNSDCIALENGFGYMQALPLDAVKKLVAESLAAASSTLQLVVVSSCHAEFLAEVFLSAGVPHVVSLPREATTFRDQGPINFARGFYGALQHCKTLREAFQEGIKSCSRDSSTSPPLLDSYKLLPEGANHRVDIFFQNPPPTIKKSMVPTDFIRDEDPMAILPPMPEQFFGREVDIYEILESLRVDDVIRIGGTKGSGKKSILSVLSRYILERSKSFQIDSVYWLPPPSGIESDPDSLYGDLCMVFQWIMAAEDDIWDEKDYRDARERILIEMEGRNSILVIDGRVFTNEIAGEILERFLTHLLNEVNVKIILITASDASRAKTKRSVSEETTIYLGPLDFQSTVKLFGNACPLVASSKENDGNGDDDSCNFNFSNIDTVDEFESYLLPESAAISDEETVDVALVDSKTPDRSQRQSELYDSMGGGNPKEILQRAMACTTDGLSDLLKIAQRPDVSVATSKELEEQRQHWIVERDHAIESKYYLRARDIEKTLGELEDLKKVYPSLDDMKAKEAGLKKTFTALLKAKRYDDANFVKRKILTLKRTMMKEKYSLSSSEDSHASDALHSINEIQKRIMKLISLDEGESMNSSFDSFLVEDGPQASSEATFSVSEGCTIEISCDRLASFWKNSSSSSTKNAAMVVWTNEACDLSGNDETMQQVLGDAVGDQISSMETLATTQWGPVRCAIGDSVLVETNDGSIALAVPPLPAKQDSSLRGKKEESLQYMETRLRNAIRSSFRKIRRKNKTYGEGVEMVVGISTTISLYGDAYREDAEETEELRYRNLAVTLNTVVEELRRAKTAGAKATVRLFASSAPSECYELIKIASELGLLIAETHTP